MLENIWMPKHALTRYSCADFFLFSLINFKSLVVMLQKMDISTGERYTQWSFCADKQQHKCVAQLIYSNCSRKKKILAFIKNVFHFSNYVACINETWEENYVQKIIKIYEKIRSNCCLSFCKRCKKRHVDDLI